MLAAVLGLSGLKLGDVPGTGVALVVALALGMAAVLIDIGRHSWLRHQLGRNGEVAEESVSREVGTQGGPRAPA